MIVAVHSDFFYRGTQNLSILMKTTLIKLWG